MSGLADSDGGEMIFVEVEVLPDGRGMVRLTGFLTRRRVGRALMLVALCAFQLRR